MSDEAIEQTARAFAEAWNAHDMGALAALYTEDADFVNVLGMWFRGRNAIEAAHRRLHEGIFRNSRLTADEVTVKRLATEVATAHVRWTLSGAEATTGPLAGERRGVMAHVLVKEGDEWRIAMTQNTDTVTPPGG